jgi:hypothetical protein
MMATPPLFVNLCDYFRQLASDLRIGKAIARPKRTDPLLEDLPVLAPVIETQRCLVLTDQHDREVLLDHGRAATRRAGARDRDSSMRSPKARSHHGQLVRPGRAHDVARRGRLTHAARIRPVDRAGHLNQRARHGFSRRAAHLEGYGKRNGTGEQQTLGVGASARDGSKAQD